MPYSALDDLQLRLLNQNIIDLNGEINVDMYVYVREATTRLEAVGSPAITVRISSPGGDLTAALDIYDLLRLYQGQVTGIVLCQAQSGAVIILQACNVRRCARHAVLLIHQGKQYLRLNDIDRPKRLKETITLIKKIQAPMDVILSDRTKKPVEELQAFYLKEQQLTAEEALAFGLVDEVV